MSITDHHANACREFMTQLFRSNYERMRKTASGCIHRYRLKHEVEVDDLINSVFEILLQVSERLAAM